jgi:hypothetical protein
VWLSILLLLFVLRELILYLLLGKQAPSTFESLLPLIAKSAIYAPLVEETVYKWMPYLLFGEKGLAGGIFLWFSAHIVERLLEGVAVWNIILTALTAWLPSSLFYFNLWRGGYFWTAYLIHSGYNILVTFCGGILGIPS